MTPNFTPTDKQLKLAKVMESPALLDILKKMEGGAVIVQNLYSNGLSLCEPIELGDSLLRRLCSLSAKLFQTLFSAGLIEQDGEADTSAIFHLTYSGTFEELVRHVS